MKICTLRIEGRGFVEDELDKVSEIRFRIDGNNYIDVSISDEKSIEIRSGSRSAFDRLAILPSSGNQIILRVIEQIPTTK